MSRELLARAWAVGAGPGDAPFTIDLDSTICETYGLAKEGARHHGYTGKRRRLADHGAAQRQQRRDDHPAGDHGLRRPGRHLHGGRQEAVPPAGADGRRAGPVGSPPEGGSPGSSKATRHPDTEERRRSQPTRRPPHQPPAQGKEVPVEEVAEPVGREQAR